MWSKLYWITGKNNAIFRSNGMIDTPMRYCSTPAPYRRIDNILLVFTGEIIQIHRPNNQTE